MISYLSDVKLCVIGLGYAGLSLAEEFGKKVTPSSRGELEITSINEVYMARGDLNVDQLGRGFAWLDTGTHESLLEAATFVQTVEKCQGYKITCLEEIAWNNGWLSCDQVTQMSKEPSKNTYGSYLLSILKA